MTKSTYIKHFENENKAIDWAVMKNKTQRDGTVYCLVDGPNNNWSVVDLTTAIDLGCGYRWFTN